MKKDIEAQLVLEVQHILDSGANEVRLVEMIKNFISKHYYTSNDVDGIYCTGVFNVVGIDGLQAELKRLEELNVKPHHILEKRK